MAYMNQEQKKQLAPDIKKVLKKYNVRGTISVKNHFTLVVTIREGPIDFETQYNEMVNERREIEAAMRERNGVEPLGRYECEGHISVNAYDYDHNHHLKFKGVAGEFFRELQAAMMGDGWYDKSEIMTDYVDIAYYMDINVGQWNKPYIYNSPLEGVA